MLFPVKVFDRDYNLKREVSVEEIMQGRDRELADIDMSKLLPPKPFTRWSKKIKCILCHDPVKVFSAAGVKCKKRECKLEWDKKPESERAKLRTEWKARGDDEIS